MKAKFKQPNNDDPMTQMNLQEIGSDLAEELNFYVTSTDDLPDMTGPEVANQLDKMLEVQTIELFLQSGDYGRGLLAGLAVGVFALELSVDQKLAVLEEEAGGEENVDDDDIENVILDSLKNGIKGGGNDSGETH